MTDYFYSPSTKLFVSCAPLRVEARVLNVAKKLGLKLRWDDEGRVNNISFSDAAKLVGKLGGQILTMRQFWQVFGDAKKASDQKMVSQLQSDRYAEWLATIFDRGNTPPAMPYGRPGWFSPDDINFSTGLPKKVELNREKGDSSWKYWSFDSFPYKAAAIRGFVTSVGKPSLDLGIPIDARQPNLLVRECRKKLLSPAVDAKIMGQAKSLVASYQVDLNANRLAKIFRDRRKISDFLERNGRLFLSSEDVETYKICEKLREMAGVLVLLSKDKQREELLVKLRRIWGVKGREVGQGFYQFVEGSRDRLVGAAKNFSDVVFVTGHRNPDTDTVVASLFEAYRNQLSEQGGRIFIPVVQGDRMPEEIVRLLGKNLAASVVLTSEKSYIGVASSGQARWIMVDHSSNPEIQKFVIAILDHHIPSKESLLQDIPRTVEVIGSTSALVVQRFYGLGLDFDKNVAKILYGATLMDTENRSELKMTPRDTMIMDLLKKKSGVKSDSDFYHFLMDGLLEESDTKRLFDRDYKEDWAFFGFAVAKVKSVFNAKGKVLKQKLLEQLVSLARENNQKKNLALTIVKVVDYLDDNSTVNRERVYLVFNKQTTKKFRQVMVELLEKIVQGTFKNKATIVRNELFLEYFGVGDQLSRKRIVPLLAPVVAVFNRYFYSPMTKLFVKREFLKSTARVRQAANGCRIKLSWDAAGRVNFVTFGEAKRLLGKLGFDSLSLPEYWKVLADAKAVNDLQMVAFLQSNGFVEFLNTVTLGDRGLVHKPKIVDGKTVFEYEGTKVTVDYGYTGKLLEASIPEGKPGLISPADIDLVTGLPLKVYSPNIYDNPELWRYWSPDASINVATRGYIFLLGQPALDLKVHLSEGFACLGVRPVAKKIEDPKVKISLGSGGIAVTIWDEGEKFAVKESEIFAKMSDFAE